MFIYCQKMNWMNLIWFDLIWFDQQSITLIKPNYVSKSRPNCLQLLNWGNEYNIRQGVWLKVAPLLILLSAFHETDLYLSFIFVSTIMIKGKGCWVPKMNSSYCLSFVWSSDYIDSIHRKSDWSYLFGHLEVGFWFNFQFFFCSNFSFP